MRMMVVLTPTDCLSDVQEVIEKHELQAYAEIPNVLGSGESKSNPEATGMFLVIATKEKSEELVDAVRGYAEATQRDKKIRIFSVPAEAVY